MASISQLKIGTTTYDLKAAQLTTARTITNSGDLSGSFSFDGSGNVTNTAYIHYCNAGRNNAANTYAYHRLLTIGEVTSSYYDAAATLYITQDYDGGAWGIARATLRTNNISSQAAPTMRIEWLVRVGFPVNTLQWGLVNNNGAATADVYYYTTGTYNSITCRVIQGYRGSVGRRWTLVNSQCTATGASTTPTVTTEVYTGVNRITYTSTGNAVDAGIVNTANSATSATTATTATKLGSSTVGATDRPIYLSSGTASQTTYRMAATNATATTARAITDNLETGIWYVNGTSGIYSQSDGVAFVNKYNDNWIGEIYQDYRTGQLAVRGKNNGTWQAWRKVLDSTNYSSWALPITGGTITGALTVSGGLLKVTNNSNTVTIGSQNNAFMHMYNSANIPFIFNNTVATTSGGLGTSTYPWNGAYMSGGIQYPTASGNNKTGNWISAGGGYGTGSGKSGMKIICCEQSDAVSGLGQDLTGLSGGYELSVVAGESTGNVAYISFAKHKIGSPTSYTRLGYFDSSGNLYSTGSMYGTSPALATAGMRKISAGTNAPSGGSNGDMYVQYK